MSGAGEKREVWSRYLVSIDSRDVDGHGRCRPSALLGHLQEAATLAAEEGGFGRDWMLKENRAFWMLSRMWFHLDRPLSWGEQLTIQTWHRGGKSALMYRDFDLLVDGAPVGEAVSAWVLADLDSHKLLRLSSIPCLENTTGGSRCKDRLLRKLRMPQDMEKTERRRMRYSDTDINAHVNNTRYADFACDALGLEQLPRDRFLTEMQLDYLMECRPGETLELYTGGADGERFVSGMDDAGKIRFEVQLNFGNINS